jgi:hypothetical protein
VRKLSTGLALLVLAGSGGCAGRTAGTPAAPEPSQTSTGTANLVPDGYTGRFRIVATVLENAEHGPQLCTGVEDSLPPQCGGPDVAGWAWTGLRYESAAGTRWGSYLLVGTFDGRVFRMTEPPKVNDGSLNPQPRIPDFTSPCPVPSGGWRPVDPARATDNALQTANAVASAEPDFAGLWLDQKQPPDNGRTAANDPTKLVLNVRFTTELRRHETDIRRVWGGALCVSGAEHTIAELTRIQQDLGHEPGSLVSSIDVVTGTVRVEVFAPTQSRQRELDARYGPGLVVLTGALEPID